jgi:hypothetical protein
MNQWFRARSRLLEKSAGEAASGSSHATGSRCLTGARYTADASSGGGARWRGLWACTRWRHSVALHALRCDGGVEAMRSEGRMPPDLGARPGMKHLARRILLEGSGERSRDIGGGGEESDWRRWSLSFRKKHPRPQTEPASGETKRSRKPARLRSMKESP